MRDSSLPPAKESSAPLTVEQTVSDGGAAVPQGDAQEIAGGPLQDTEPRKVSQDLRSKPIRGDRFEQLAQDEIKKTFPGAFVRVGVQIRSLRRSAEVDLFVLMPKGLFLIECKNYSGKIRGSLNYDQKQGEFWTCQTATGEIVQITSSGKNPADQALTRFHALHDMAKEAWGEANRPYIYPILLFPDAADLSEITQMTVTPERPATTDRVVATTLSKLIGYLANSESPVEQTGALKLLDFLGIPRASVSGTWLDKPVGRETTQQIETELEKSPGIGDTQEIKVSESEDFKKPESSTEKYPQQRGQRTRRPAVAATAIVVGLMVVFVIGWLILKPSTPTPTPDLASRKQPSTQQTSTEPSLPPSTPENPVASPESSQQATLQPAVGEKLSSASELEQTAYDSKQKRPLGDKGFSGNRQGSATPADTGEASVRERPITRGSAEPGTYETIRTTSARREPNDRSDVVDELSPRTRLNVTGSLGDWLVVKSRTRQMTVYVRRDDAMFVSVTNPAGESYQGTEARWKKVEADITESLAKWGLPPGEVTASFRDGTAYLEGQVKTDYERFRAEMAARSIPDVQIIINRIRLVR